MSEKVRVIISGEQRSEDECNHINETHEAIYHYMNSQHIVKYSGDGKASDNYLIKIADRSVDIIRKGDINSNMSFEKREMRHTHYVTPAGILELDIYTKELDIYESKERIHIVLKYDIIFGGVSTNENKMDIYIEFQ